VFHVVPAIFAYAALTAGSVAGIAYLLLERQIKSKKRGVLLRGLPNLDLVEKVNAAAVIVGTPLLVLGAVVGIVQGHVALGQNFHWDPKVWVTLAIIGIFVMQLCLRRFAGWFGKRSVLISLLGFIALVIGVTIVNIYFSDLHGFDR
jgi:ABC-type transport system involved in cytochrome c biogenesis permease subunit